MQQLQKPTDPAQPTADKDLKPLITSINNDSIKSENAVMNELDKTSIASPDQVEAAN